jgi:hypothetical protein
MLSGFFFLVITHLFRLVMRGPAALVSRAMNELLAVALLALALTTPAHDSPPVARYNELGRMVYVGGLTSDEQRIKCAKFIVKGIVTFTEFDNRHRLVNFGVRARKSSAWRFPIIYPESLEAVDLEKLPTLITKGARLKVTAYGCGAAAAFVEPDVIEALSVTSATRRAHPRRR